MPKKKEAKKQVVTISEPNDGYLEADIVGTAPYVQLAFSAKAQAQMEAIHTTTAAEKKKKSKDRPPRDYDDDFRNALHVSEGGWHGFPAAGLRNALISACKNAGFVMTRAKISIFVEADGHDVNDGMPMVRIHGIGPNQVRHHVRNSNGSTDLRVRGMWPAGWTAKVRLRYDADVYTPSDVANMLLRAGRYVGLGEGRPDSKKSCGMGWGLFDIKRES